MWIFGHYYCHGCNIMLYLNAIDRVFGNLIYVCKSQSNGLVIFSERGERLPPTRKIENNKRKKKKKNVIDP